MTETNDQNAQPRQEWGFRFREAPDVIDPGYKSEEHARLCASRAAGAGIVTRFHSGSGVSEWQDVPDAEAARDEREPEPCDGDCDCDCQPGQPCLCPERDCYCGPCSVCGPNPQRAARDGSDR